MSTSRAFDPYWLQTSHAASSRWRRRPARL